MGLLDFWHRFQRTSQAGRALKALCAEVDANLEACYVMFQINRRRSFQTAGLQAMAGFADIKFDDAMERYVRAIDRYQTALHEFQEYERWYTADPERKTKENAQLLHEKKATVETCFDGLEPVIKAAQASVTAMIRENSNGPRT